MTNPTGIHWTKKMSVEEGEILLRWMLHGERFADKETETILQLMSEMKVTPSTEILDLCCGYGRHAVRLAEKGFKVTGVDLSQVNINYARRFAEERGVSKLVRFLVGDAREVEYLLESQRETFEGIVAILPSIGYYDANTDESILGQLFRLSKSEGVLILNVANRDYHMQRLRVSKERITGQPTYEVHHSYRFDYEKSRRTDSWTIYEVQDQNLRFISAIEVDIRLYSIHELISLFGSSGWTYTKSYGNNKLEPVDAQKPTLIIIGQKTVVSEIGDVS